jgi:predicted AAA+ superfamily ATPase
MFKKRLILSDIEKYINSPEALIISGMRRTGKTTLLKHLFNKIKSKNKLFLDLENPINRKYFEEENYEQIKKAFEFLGNVFYEKLYVFLDEIQFVKNLPSIVKYFIDNYGVKFFLTGSASFYLKNLFIESLAGRKIIFEINPLTFSEFLEFKSVNFRIPQNIESVTKEIHETIKPLYEEYLFYGGFPQVVLKNNVEAKKKAIEDVFTSFYQLEVLQLGDFRKNEVLRDLMLLLMQRAGTKLDVLRLSKELRISRQTLNNYISFLRGTYFLHTVTPFTRGADSEIRKTPKVYFCDCGILNSFTHINKGVLFENAVFQNLRVKGKINYFQKKSCVEIDFIFENKYAFEIKTTSHESDVRKLKNLSSQLKLKNFKVVSLEYSYLKNVIYPYML